MTAGNWITIAQIVIAGGMAWLGWSVRALKACIRGDVKSVASEVKLVATQLAALERRVEAAEAGLDKKVSDEEWIRESMRLRNDVADMGKTLARIEGKTDSTLMLATSVNRVAVAIEKNQEATGA